MGMKCKYSTEKDKQHKLNLGMVFMRVEWEKKRQLRHLSFLPTQDLVTTAADTVLTFLT